MSDSNDAAPGSSCHILYLRYYLLYRDNGEEDGSYCLGLRVIEDRYIPLEMENKTENDMKVVVIQGFKAVNFDWLCKIWDKLSPRLQALSMAQISGFGLRIGRVCQKAHCPQDCTFESCERPYSPH